MSLSGFFQQHQEGEGEQQQQQQRQQPEEEGGKIRNMKPDWIVGKIYAEWCGHCKDMEPSWNRLKKIYKSGKIKFMEIQDIEMETKLPDMNNTYFQKGNQNKVTSSGFPTIFMFQVKNPNKTLEYYKGGRDYLSMKEWINKKMGKNAVSRKGIWKHKMGKNIVSRKGVWKKHNMRGGKTNKRKSKRGV